MPQGDHPDEVFVDPMSSEHLRRRNSLPNRQYPPAGRPTESNNVLKQRSPFARNHSLGPLQAPETPISGAPNNLGPLKCLSDAKVKPAQLPTPRLPANPSAAAAQALPPPRLLPHNVQCSTIAPATETPGLESSNSTDHEPPVGFFTARSAESLQNGSGLPAKAAAFDPHLESPSIRKTAGVDHSKTKPIGREVVGAVQSPAVPRASFVNPQTDKNRRLGMPVGCASPLQNRGSYKPPQMKRPAEANGIRPALGDMTAASVNIATEDGNDVKRQKVGLEVQGDISNGIC